MNFPLDNLTYKENLNFFSTPKFKEIKFDIEGQKKNVFFKNAPISKNSPIYVAKNPPTNILENTRNESNIINIEENPYKENKNEIFLKENFSLSSLKNNNSNNGKLINNKKIIDLKINCNKKNKEENCNIALISFCDKSDNYSLNNYSCSGNKDKQEIFNNLRTQTEKNYKESEIINNGTNKANNSNKSNSNSNGNNSSSFKYNLPLENDKMPLINDFMNYQDNNNNNNNNNNKNEIVNNINKVEKSLILNNNNLENTDNNIKINKSIKEDLLCHYKNNIINNSDVNSSQKKLKISKTEKFYHIGKFFPFEKNNNNDISLKNKSFIERNGRNNNKLIINKPILHSYDNYKKIKKKIKISAINEIENRVKEKGKKEEIKINTKKIKKITSPRKKFELIIKQIDINVDNNHEDLTDDNFDELYSFTTRESKISSVMHSVHDSNLNSYRKIENNIYNKNKDNDFYRISNTTNRLKNKNRKLIKNSVTDYNKTFFNFNKIKKIDENDNKTIVKHNKSKELNYINKKINSIYKNNISKNYINKDLKFVNTKKYSYHTRNISNLYSNKIFNGIKNLFNNNNGIFNTVNYESNDISKKFENKKIFQTKIKIKPHNKIIGNKEANLPNKNEIKIKSINKIYKKEIPKLYLRNNNPNKLSLSNNINYNIDNKYNTISQEKNNKIKNHFNLIKKVKKDNEIKNKIPSFNKLKNNFLKNKNSQKTIKFQNKNQTTYKLPTTSPVISGFKTDRNIYCNNNYSSVNMNNKSLINDSIFINVNDSTNSLQNDSRYNKIKVNKKNMNKKIPHLSDIPLNNNNKTNSYWKIHKKPKNSCLISNYNSEMNKNEDINYNNKYHITLGESYEKYIKGNTQLLIFNKNKPNKLQDLNNLKERIHQYNLTNNNSKSNLSESSYTDRNNYSISINDNLNIEKTKLKFRSKKIEDIDVNININKAYQNENINCIKPYNKNNFINNKSNELTNIKIPIDNNYKSKIKNYKEEMLKYSILRNNQNNQIINEFSIILGEEKDKKNVQNGKNLIKNKLEECNKSLENKRTIINVNQFYPSYYIANHEIVDGKNKI